ncbi:MAG: flagellar basal body rod protein FlgC [Bryobacteraceae bacterium]
MSLFHLLSVSASGLEAQRRRAEVLTENLANAETTRTSQGGPYRRKDVIFESAKAEHLFQSVFRNELGSGVEGVRVAEVVEDQRDPEKRYIPGHPDADTQGYVAFPRINPAEDMVDLLNTTRSYQSNIAAMSAVKDMIQRSLDLMR